MILNNVIIGHARYGHELKCGDICIYKFEGKQCKGMIAYDDDAFCFVFVQLDESFPELYMHCVDYSTIEKIISIRGMDESFPDADKWAELYNAKLWPVEL